MRLSFRRFGVGIAVPVLLLAGCSQSGQSPSLVSRLTQSRKPVEQSTARRSFEVKLSLGRALEQRGRYGEALKAYEEVVRMVPEHPKAVHRLAVLYDRQGHFDRSAKLFEKALELNPGNPEVFCDVGYSLYLQQRWEQAEMQFRQAIELAPNHPRSHNNLGLVLAHTGRPDESLAEFRKAGSRSAEAHMNLAFVMTLNSRWDDAQHHYQLALKEDPQSPEARTRLAQLGQLISATDGNSAVAAQKGELAKRPEPVQLTSGTQTIPYSEGEPKAERRASGHYRHRLRRDAGTGSQQPGTQQHGFRTAPSFHQDGETPEPQELRWESDNRTPEDREQVLKTPERQELRWESDPL